MAGPTAVLGLFLITGPLTSLGFNVRYYRETNRYLSVPDETVSVTSVTDCAAVCSSKRTWVCGTFTYHQGDCYLFYYFTGPRCVSCAIPVPNIAPDTTSGPVSYRRDPDCTTCPGKLSSQCCRCRVSAPRRCTVTSVITRHQHWPAHKTHEH